MTRPWYVWALDNEKDRVVRCGVYATREKAVQAAVLDWGHCVWMVSQCARPEVIV